MESRATTRNKSALYSDLSRTLATTLSSTSTAANSKVLKQRELRYNKLSSLNSNVNNSTSSGMNVLGTSRVTTTANTDFEAAVICPIAVFQQTPYYSSISSATVNINTNTNTTYTHATSLSASTKKPKNRDSQDFELDFDAMANTKNILSTRMKKIPKGVQAVYIGTTLQEKIKRKNTKKTKKLVFTKKSIYSYLDEYINSMFVLSVLYHTLSHHTPSPLSSTLPSYEIGLDKYYWSVYYNHTPYKLGISILTTAAGFFVFPCHSANMYP
ncbi:hypothetical protein AX774_g2411 [Zancudomyces culisetae]|uniref:Uncharacterized protein n=1 Tax=Zancudomyces culisetae TaxID=1213189 RepID=A0A1R1PSU7_ZANCU|nr:hypothetical protein AX774_g2411 [Zancudomyces culisetae]|eukprot:OMH84065.1 hypothetical protein AX774_g2411 [Zancudomyces culisetae]